MKIALISPPWPLFNRPSIQTAALKAYLLQQDPELKIKCMHPYLFLAARLGFDNYHKISQSSWAAESICAGILFPEQISRCNRLFHEALKKKRADVPLDPDDVREVTGLEMRRFVCSVDWKQVSLAGISVCLNQFTSSLLLAREIKKRNPETIVVLGGASCAGAMGLSMLDTFPQVDFVVNGEGERPLLGLIRYVQGLARELPPGVSARKPHVYREPEKDQIGKMNDLPVPDFSDYFREVNSIPPAKRFFPVLPVEFSRGCWWGRCAFCNLNLQWSGYRAKSAERMMEEVLYLARRYSVLDFAFMDNVLPRRDALKFFRQISRQNLDLGFFAEIRAGQSREEIMAMAKGGLSEIQVGIEALSSSLLKRMGKGVKLIDNLAAMRHAEEAGIRLSGNLILHFPGSTEEEVAETLRVLDLVLPYRPLKTVSFWLGLESPVYMNPDKYSIWGLKPHPFFAELFPREVLEGMEFLVSTYRGDRQRQVRQWKQVEEKVRLWHMWHAGSEIDFHPLSFRDGGDFLYIKRAFSDRGVVTHRLSGLSRELYLLCTDPRPLEQVFDQASGLSRERVMGFIQDLQQKGLMFMGDEKVLSLAVHHRRSVFSD